MNLKRYGNYFIGKATSTFAHKTMCGRSGQEGGKGKNPAACDEIKTEASKMGIRNYASSKLMRGDARRGGVVNQRQREVSVTEKSPGRMGRYSLTQSKRGTAAGGKGDALAKLSETFTRTSEKGKKKEQKALRDEEENTCVFVSERATSSLKRKNTTMRIEAQSTRPRSSKSEKTSLISLQAVKSGAAIEVSLRSSGKEVGGGSRGFLKGKTVPSCRCERVIGIEKDSGTGDPNDA